MAAPNSMEMELIKQFRTDVQDVLDETRLSQDHFLLRWIRARDHNLGKAKEMLENSLAWREEHQIDTVLQSKKSDYFEAKYKYWVHGHDKHGRPLLLAPSGKWDIKGMINNGKSEELSQEFARMMEDILKSINSSGNMVDEDHPVTQFTVIADWREFFYGQVTSFQAISKLLEMVCKFEAHYPETVNAIFFINCPKIFSWVLPMIKACMSGVTVSKLQVYGSNKLEWQQVVLGLIDPENLFPEYGGTANYNEADK